MLLVTSNKARRLLRISYIGHVRLEEFHDHREDMLAQLAEMPPNFCLLADFSTLEKMDWDCAPEMGRMMDLLSQSGVDKIVRVIPDASKDIGMNILTLFHYPNHPEIITRANMVDAAKELKL